jgi:transcriptional regulator with XRE-family HTH domain
MPEKKRRAPGLKEQLREAIRESGKSLNQLSKVCGVGNDRLSRFMRGERGLTIDAVEKICIALRLGLAPLPPEATPTRRRRQAGQGGGAETN